MCTKCVYLRCVSDLGCGEVLLCYKSERGW